MATSQNTSGAPAPQAAKASTAATRTPAPVASESFGQFVLKILNGTTIAIVVALIPNAILATFIKPFPDCAPLMEFYHTIVAFQFLTPVMAGFLIAHQFKFNPIQMATVAGATFIGSGAWKFVPAATVADKTAPLFQLAGIGDIINVMICAALTVAVVRAIGTKLGSLTIVLLPIIAGAGMGFVGWKLLPYVSQITFFIGQIINTFTTLQPWLMCMLIAASFSIIIISPLSTVAIGIAIGLTGMSSAAAGMGVGACAAMLVWACARVNKAGVPIAVALGAMKMMMPNFMTRPVMAIPAALTAAISALTIPLWEMGGTPASSGFGLVGFVSPLAALSIGNVNIIQILIAWVVIPFAVGFVVNKVLCDVVHLYDKDLFKFKG